MGQELPSCFGYRGGFGGLMVAIVLGQWGIASACSVEANYPHRPCAGGGGLQLGAENKKKEKEREGENEHTTRDTRDGRGYPAR